MAPPEKKKKPKAKKKDCDCEKEGQTFSPMDAIAGQMAQHPSELTSSYGSDLPPEPAERGLFDEALGMFAHPSELTSSYGSDLPPGADQGLMDQGMDYAAGQMAEPYELVSSYGRDAKPQAAAPGLWEQLMRQLGAAQQRKGP